MALVVTGRVRHPGMAPSEVQHRLSKHLPGLVVGGQEFSADRSNCRVEFFCNNSKMLDFTVIVTGSTLPAPATVALLVRETDSLHLAMTKALRKRMRKAWVKYSVLEDERSRSNLLTWSFETPLTSRPAKLSYLLCLILLALAGYLVSDQLRQPSTTARNDNIVSLLLAICLPAFTLPLPFLFERLKSGRGGRWLFLQMGGE